jgi:hypothetical protein
MKRSSQSTCRNWKSFLPAALLASLWLAGCVGNTKLDEIQKAKLIREKRREAADWLAKFKASDSQDLDPLERYVRLQQETIEIAPSTCPNCHAAYGEALSMLGWYYWEDYSSLLDEAESASPQKARQLRAEADQVKEEWVKYFTLSNNYLEGFFRDPTVPNKHPYFYERVMRHYQLMENYERALYYLQKYEENYPPFMGRMEEPARQRVEELRRFYRQESQRQKERGVKVEEKRPKPSPLRRPAPPRRREREAGDSEE